MGTIVVNVGLENAGDRVAYEQGSREESSIWPSKTGNPSGGGRTNNPPGGGRKR